MVAGASFPSSGKGMQTRAAADVPIVTAILLSVEHLLPILAQAPSPSPKNRRQPPPLSLFPCNSGHRSQYGLLAAEFLFCCFDIPFRSPSWDVSEKSTSSGKARRHGSGRRVIKDGS